MRMDLRCRKRACRSSHGHDAIVAAGRAHQLADLDPQGSGAGDEREVRPLAGDFAQRYGDTCLAGGGKRPRLDGLLRLIEDGH